MKRDDIVVMLKHGHERELWCVLACGPKTFDLVAYSGYVERHKHGNVATRPATAADFHDRNLDAISDDDGFFRLSAENEHANLRIGDWGCTDGGHDAKGVPEGRQLDMSARQN